MSPISSSPPRAPPIKYPAPLGTRWAKETAAAGGIDAFDLPTDPSTVGPWILGECVGKGASGRVKIAKHHLTGQLAAVKILPVAPVVSSRTSLATQQAKSEKQRLGIDREITMMKLMNHPNIMRIYDVYEGKKELFLVLEYVEGGELFDFLVNRGRLPPTEALAFFKQLIYGLNYAHTFSIIHRDLKPENILIASLSPPLIKIADWGMAAFAHPSMHLETSCGSPHYASPEIVNGQTYKGNATDIWSCGVILYALLTGRLPFDDKNVRILLSKVKSGKYDMPAWIDPLAKDLLSKMLVVDVEKRIKMPEIISHPWFQSSSVPASIEQQAAELAMAQLPPSPSTLARPIASPSLIDPELFASLRVIWGRHTDPNGDSIKRDLCSPVGQGVHAKAFYFLLSRYREESSRKNLEEGGDKFNLGWELSSANKLYDRKRNSMYSIEASNSHTSPTAVPVLIPDPTPLIRRYSGDSRGSSSRERPSSPAGPRAHKRMSVELWRSQPGSQDDRLTKSPVNAPGLTSFTGVGRGGPHPAWPSRGFTHTHPQNGIISTLQFPKQLQAQDILDQHRPKPITFVPPPDLLIDRTIASTVTTPAPPPPRLKMHAPRPVLAPKIMPEVSMLNDALVDAHQEPRKALSDMQIETAIPLTVASPRTVIISGQQDALVLDIASIPGPVAVPPEPSDKENRNVDDAVRYVEPEVHRRGLGLGVGREMGKAMENITNVPEVPLTTKSKKKKDKKPRPPTLDFRGLNQQKRATILGSPTNTSPRLAHFPTARLMTSPVIEEFKGWFSNLFSWKTHGNGSGGVIYSMDGIYQTRTSIRQLLEGMGVVIENNSAEETTSPVDHCGPLKCHVEDLNGSRSALNLKAVRFRIEIFASPAQYGVSSASPLNQESIACDQNTMMACTTSAKPRSTAWVNKNHTAPMPSPSPDSKFPVGCTCAVYMAYEKGSISSFRLIWRRLKEDYRCDAVGSPCYLSPAMASTPVAEYAEVING